MPVVPVVSSSSAPRQTTKEEVGPSVAKSSDGVTTGATNVAAPEQPSEKAPESTQANSEEAAKPTSPARVAPKSWADLVRSKALAKSAAASSAPSAMSNGVVKPKSETLADVLTSLGDDVSQYSDKVAFLEPRGLVNTGNMCYMNSVCWPFFSPCSFA